MVTTDKTNAIQLLTAKDVGAMLSLSKRQVFRLHSSSKIPKAIRIGGSVRWARSTIAKWLELGAPDRKTFEARKEAENAK
jgi:predicted DNA-binding transcriptional regulator AlpA